MALLDILEYPDPRLRTKAKPVAEVEERHRTLAADMLETMYDAPGIGLAASQVNVHERIIVVDVSEDQSDPHILINPSPGRQVVCRLSVQPEAYPYSQEAGEAA